MFYGEVEKIIPELSASLVVLLYETYAYFMFVSACWILGINQGPVVQSVVSLTSSLRVISLTVLANSIYNILIFFAEKM